MLVIHFPCSVERSDKQGKVFLHDASDAWLADLNSRYADDIAAKLNEWEMLCVVATHAENMLAYIQMRMAYSATMSVDEILNALEQNKNVSSIEIAHHLGCSLTTRRVDLETVTKALAALKTLRAERTK